MAALGVGRDKTVSPELFRFQAMHVFLAPWPKLSLSREPAVWVALEGTVVAFCPSPYAPHLPFLTLSLPFLLPSPPFCCFQRPSSPKMPLKSS